MESQVMKFNARIYQITGKSYLCPDNSTKKGDYVIAFDPLKQVDPAKWYAFVIPESGEEQSVSRKYLQSVKKVELEYTRKPYSTHGQETSEKLMVMRQHIKDFILENRESEQAQQATSTSNP